MMSRRQGFTLVELLIYLAITGAIAVSLVQFSLSISNARSKTFVAQEVQANARMVMEVMRRKIKMASGVNLGSSSFGSDPGALSLAMVDGTNDPVVLALDEDDGRLQMTEGGEATVYVTSDQVKVTNLVFTDLTAGGDRENIRIEMTIAYDSANDVIYEYERSYETAVSLRQ